MTFPHKTGFDISCTIFNTMLKHKRGLDYKHKSEQRTNSSRDKIGLKAKQVATHFYATHRQLRGKNLLNCDAHSAGLGKKYSDV